jgi:AcrR family transcriptional regulator
VKSRVATKRVYHQRARAAAAEQTAQRILDAFESRIRESWYDQITLDEVARRAGVTVPTLIRRFGSKEGILGATWKRLEGRVTSRRKLLPGDVDGALRVLIEDYEEIGDMVIRALAQEDRFPALKTANDGGRAHHRRWIEATFAPWLDGAARAARQTRVDALVAATDLYVWKIVRRDMGRSRRQLRILMLQLIEGALAESPSAE